MHTDNLRKLAIKTNDGVLRGPVFDAADEIDRLRAEIERLNNALTEAANQIGDLATRLGQAEGRLDASELVGVVEGWKARAETAEAERDEARAQVAVNAAVGKLPADAWFSAPWWAYIAAGPVAICSAIKTHPHLTRVLRKRGG